MKKIMIGIALLISAICVNAENFLDVSGNQHDRIWVEMKDNQHRLATGATLTNGLSVTGTLAATAVTSASRPVVTANDASTLIQSGVGVSTALTYTNTFTTAYAGGVTPAVVYGANNVGGTNTLTVTSNGFTIVYGMTNVTTRWIAVGTK